MRNYPVLINAILLFGCLSLTGVQADDSADCQFPIEPGTSSLRVLTLSESGYACMRKSNYRDVSIVNGDGNAVPRHIVHPSSRSETIDYLKSLQYSFDSEDAHHRYYKHLRYLVRSTPSPRHGAIYYYQIEAPSYEVWVQRHDHPTSIIVENTDTEGNLAQLRFDFNNQGNININATAYLEYSDDLIHWTSSSLPQKLFHRYVNENSVVRKHLNTGGNRKSRYIRIVVLSNVGNFAASIRNIEGLYQRTRVVSPEYIWTKATSIQELSDGQDWQFSMPDQLPISRLRFKPENGIVFYSGKLSSKPINLEVPEDNAYLELRESGKKRLKNALKRIVKGRKRTPESINSGWRTAIRFQQYHSEYTDTDEKPPNSEPITFPHRASRHWRIEFRHPSAEMIASQFPVVEFGWTAARVRFLAQGPEPFTLRVGKTVKSPQPTVTRILWDKSGTFEAVDLLPGETAVSIAQSSPSDDQPYPEIESDPANKQIIIWIVLIVGVLAMAYMAWQLLRSIENSTGEDL